MAELAGTHYTADSLLRAACGDDQIAAICPQLYTANVFALMHFTTAMEVMFSSTSVG